MVYEIYDDGAIAKDDRLSCGDQILEVRLCLFFFCAACAGDRFYMFQNGLNVQLCHTA